MATTYTTTAIYKEGSLVQIQDDRANAAYTKIMSDFDKREMDYLSAVEALRVNTGDIMDFFNDDTPEMAECRRAGELKMAQDGYHSEVVGDVWTLTTPLGRIVSGPVLADYTQTTFSHSDGYTLDKRALTVELF